MRCRYNGRLFWAAEELIVVVALVCIALLPAKAFPETPLSPPARRIDELDSGGASAEILPALIAEAVRDSPLIIAARRRWQADTKLPVQESTPPDPEVTFQNLAAGNAIPGNDLQTNNFAYFGYGFSQEIPYPGKLRLRATVAEKDAEAACADHEAQTRQVIEQVSETYFNLFYLARTLDLLQQTSREFQGVERSTESQYQVGMAQQQDVLKAQLEMTTILKEIETAREEFGQGQADLKAILGREPDSPDIRIGGVKLTAFNISSGDLRKLALGRAPRLKAAEAMEAKAEQSLKLAREGYIPDLSVAYMYQKTGARFPDYYMATVGVKIPLWFWRKQTPAVEQADLEKSSARAQAYATRLSVLSQAQNQWIAIQSTGRIAQLFADGLIPQAQATLASAMATYRVGKIDFQTLLSAEIDLLSLRQQYYRTLADHEIAVAKIQQIIGSVR